MKKPMTSIAFLGSLLLLGACGGAHDEAAPAADTEDSIAAPLHDSIEKAEAVEDQVMEHKEAIDEALEKAEDETPL